MADTDDQRAVRGNLRQRSADQHDTATGWTAQKGAISKYTRGMADHRSPEEMVERQKQTLRDAVPDATGERGTEIYDPSVGVGPTAGPYAGVDEDGNTLVAPLAGRGSYEGGDDGQEALDEEELKGMQKKDLLKLAEKRGVEADDKMTNDEIRNKLLGK